ncbi:hypothetical protein A1Q2_01075 [Trichosporon asahii var. asahii CBS 8904]|uniref:Uncharacterized protein n=1 Tax=Trichosporon asahii var. asahii (strain CBS 8904) TaxID=1220162 RepID=K1VKC6_TRIAC|nr:hypothetical protein A1Q2_01075 [Trichosporon asahii var. asahii CBS 8904]
MPDPFGSFGWICQHTALPQCNLLFNQIWQNATDLEVLFPANSTFYHNYTITPSTSPDEPKAAAARRDAGSGLGNDCVIPRVTTQNSLGDIGKLSAWWYELMAATVVVSFVSLLMVFALLFLSKRRRAAVGRSELQIFLIVSSESLLRTDKQGFGFMSALQAVTMSSMLEQASQPLVILSAIHCAAIAAVAWMLVYNGIIATQVLDMGLISAAFFGGTCYVALAVGFNYNDAFFVGAEHPEQLKTNVRAVVIYLLIMIYVTFLKLKEAKPAIILIAGSVLFAGGQVVQFLASQPLCRASHSKVNGSFLMSFAMDLAVGLVFFAWLTITEEDWDDHMWYA